MFYGFKDADPTVVETTQTACSLTQNAEFLVLCVKKNCQYFNVPATSSGQAFLRILYSGVFHLVSLHSSCSSLERNVQVTIRLDLLAVPKGILLT